MKAWTIFHHRLLPEIVYIVHNQIDLCWEQNIHSISSVHKLIRQSADAESFGRVHDRVDTYIQLKSRSSTSAKQCEIVSLKVTIHWINSFGCDSGSRCGRRQNWRCWVFGSKWNISEIRSNEHAFLSYDGPVFDLFIFDDSFFMVLCTIQICSTRLFLSDGIQRSLIFLWIGDGILCEEGIELNLQESNGRTRERERE